MKLFILILAIVCTVIGMICAFNGLMLVLTTIDIENAIRAILLLLFGAGVLSAALWLLERTKP